MPRIRYIDQLRPHTRDDGLQDEHRSGEMQVFEVYDAQGQNTQNAGFTRLRTRAIAGMPKDANLHASSVPSGGSRFRAPQSIGGIMKKSSLTVAASMLGLALALAPIASVQGAELQIIAGGGIEAPLKEIAAQFESATGHKVAIRYGTTPELIKMATSGPFDLGVVPQDVLKDAAARARFAPEPTPDVARVGIGVAVRAGAPKPDISTPEALKQTLLQTQSIASIPASATGTQLAGIYSSASASQTR